MPGLRSLPPTLCRNLDCKGLLTPPPHPRLAKRLMSVCPSTVFVQFWWNLVPIMQIDVLRLYAVPKCEPSSGHMMFYVSCEMHFVVGCWSSSLAEHGVWLCRPVELEPFFHLDAHFCMSCLYCWLKWQFYITCLPDNFQLRYLFPLNQKLCCWQLISCNCQRPTV